MQIEKYGKLWGDGYELLKKTEIPYYDRYPDLKERWTNLTQDPNYFYIIQTAYSTGRYYHNLRHIKVCLKYFDEVCSVLKPDYEEEMEMAIFFHDFVYNTKGFYNEAKSAERAILYMDKKGYTTKQIGRVILYILATTHSHKPIDLQWAIVVDCDLAELAAEPKRFKLNNRNIRKEYRHLTNAEFYQGNTQFLQRFLDRDFIYHTDYFREKYEDKARKNLANLIAERKELQ